MTLLHKSSMSVTNFSTIFPYLTKLSLHRALHQSHQSQTAKFAKIFLAVSTEQSCHQRDNICRNMFCKLQIFAKGEKNIKKYVTFLHNIQRICTNCFRENTKKEFSNPTLHIVCGYTPRLIDQLVLSPCSQSSETWKFYTNLHVWNHQKAESGRNLIRIFKIKHLSIVRI